MNHVLSADRQAGRPPVVKSLLLLLLLNVVDQAVYLLRSSTFVHWILRDNVGKGIESLIFVKNQGLSWALQ